MKSIQSIIRWSGLLLCGVLAAGGSASAEPPEKTESSVAWPPGVIRHPLYVLDLPNADAKRDTDADKSAAIRAYEEARSLLERHEAGIVVDSLFADNRVLSDQPITWLLVANRIPFIETNVDDARWIFFHAKRPGTEALRARGKRFVRFKLARDGDRDCFRGDDESPYVNFAVSVPKKRGECIVIEFTNKLRSKYRLGIDLTSKANRVAYYELSEISSNEPILRIPFWNMVSRGILQLPGNRHTYFPPSTLPSMQSEVRARGEAPIGGANYYSYSSGAITWVLNRMRGPAYPN